MTTRIITERILQRVRLTLDFESNKGYSYYWVVSGVKTSIIWNYIFMNMCYVHRTDLVVGFPNFIHSSIINYSFINRTDTY